MYWDLCSNCNGTGKVKMICSYCRGTGIIKERQRFDCLYCGGTGSRPSGGSNGFTYISPCIHCNGKGFSYRESQTSCPHCLFLKENLKEKQCPRCLGRGQISKTRVVDYYE